MSLLAPDIDSLPRHPATLGLTALEILKESWQATASIGALVIAARPLQRPTSLAGSAGGPVMTSACSLAVSPSCSMSRMDGRPAERREDYDWFASFADTLPVRVTHGVPVITSSGV
jgi:hypothetical protein